MKKITSILIFLISITVFAQKQKSASKIQESLEVEKPTLVLQPKRFYTTPPISQLPPNDNRAQLEGKIIPKDGVETSEGLSTKRQRKLDYLNSAGKSPTSVDPLKDSGFELLNETQTRAPLVAFDGIGLDVNPPDPSMAVGPNHIVTMENGQWAVYDKQGVLASGFPRALTDPLQAPGSTANAGDPVVMYDREADRWFISQFQLPSGNAFLIGISQTPDPTGAYNVYEYELGAGNDYPHYGIWGDTYVTAGNFTGAQKVYTFNRTKMLAGDATAEIVGFSPPNLSGTGFTAPIPVHSEGAGVATGPVRIVYYQDDAFPGVANGNDHIGLWTVDMDWTNATTIANSTISGKTEIPTTPFDAAIAGGFSNIAQPGTTQRIDAIVGTVMNMCHWYKFPTYESILMNWVVEVTDGSQISGIRWVELRSIDGGNNWSVYQEGTFEDPTGNESVFMGCIAMDIEGNIGLGYTKSGTSTFPSLYYTGRRSNDDLGTMTFAEDLAFAGTSSVTGIDRYGDYGQAVRDPSDDLTFWVTSEYSGNAGNDRRVGVYSFKLSTEFENDIAIIDISQPENGDDLTGSETVEIMIQNFGSTEAANIPVTYTLNGGAVVSGTVVGPLSFGQTATFSFTPTVNLSANGSYEICASVALPGDENNQNNSLCETIINFDCLPGDATGGCNIDGIKRFVLGDINADDGGVTCNTENPDGIVGYSDRTDLSTELDRASGLNTHLLQAQSNYDPADFGGVLFDILSVWVDFNDNGEFETSEQLLNGVPFTSADELNDFTLVIPIDAALGAHVLRAKSFDPGGAGSSTDPCGAVEFGEVQDYTVVITDSSLACDTISTFTNAGGWSNGVPDSNTAVIIDGNYDAVTQGNLTTCDLTINIGATLSLGLNGATVHGNFINDGTVNGSTGSLTFAGDTAQIAVSSSGSVSIGDLIIDNASGGVTLSNPFDVYQLVTLTSGNLTTNGNLTFKSTATGTAEIAQVPASGTSILGDVTVERFIPAKRAFRFLTSAVSTASPINSNWQEGGSGATDNPNAGFGTHITGSTSGANGFDETASGNPSMFTFSAVGQAFNAIPNTDTDQFTRGVPYLTMVRGSRAVDLTTNAATPDDTVLRATGALQIGTITQNGLSTVAGEFNFIGNPYQATVDMTQVLENSSNLNDSQYYIWDPNLGERGQYVTILLPAGTNTSGSDGTQYLQVGQSAFVTTLANGAASAQFDEASKAVDNETNTFNSINDPIANSTHIIGQLYRTEGLDTNEGLQDSFGILFSEEYTNALTNEDAVKPVNIDENMGVDNADVILSIERRALPEETEIIQLYLANYKNEFYTFKFTVTGLTATPAYLLDTYLDQYTPLHEGENLIAFDITNGGDSLIADRFQIVFNTETLDVDTNEIYNFVVHPNPVSGDALSITASGLNGNDALIEITNLLGQKISSQTVSFENSNAVINGFEHLSNGVYLLSMYSSNKTVTRKIIKE